jgi:uncharacterized surface protein with fasciclin (FAS1) repeats
LTLALAVVACNDEEIDEHYDQLDSALEVNLKDLIAEDADLSTFYTLLQKTGYDTILTNSQSYTVWAPTNDAFDDVSTDILNDDDLLSELIGNHISRYSYTSNDIGSDGLLVKMFNEKYVQNLITNGVVYFDEAEVIEGDLLSSNGILHKIGDAVSVKSNIWTYLGESGDYSTLVDYMTQYESVVFDASASTITGQNSLGKDVYDSVFVTENNFFDVIGDLSDEEQRYSFVALTDEVYTAAYDIYKDYYQHPIEDTISSNVNYAIFSNLNFDELSDDQYGTWLANTIGNYGYIDNGSIDENIQLSNGNVLKMNSFDFLPKYLIYKTVRYEVENSARRTVGDATALTISKIYSVYSSGYFSNKVQLDENPNDDETNNYFEVEFSNVLSADYDVYIKFTSVSASQDTKLKFQFTYNDSIGSAVVDTIESMVISNEEEGLIKIGDTYSNQVYVNSDEDNDYLVKLRVYVDVSEAELVLYDRVFGIDYIKLVPAE